MHLVDGFVVEHRLAGICIEHACNPACMQPFTDRPSKRIHNQIRRLAQQGVPGHAGGGGGVESSGGWRGHFRSSKSDAK